MTVVDDPKHYILISVPFTAFCLCSARLAMASRVVAREVGIDITTDGVKNYSKLTIYTNKLKILVEQFDNMRKQVEQQ